MGFISELISAGGALVYGLIFLAGLGLPVPLAPLLLLVGAGLAGARVHPLAGAILPPVMLSLGDIVWFYIGRYYGTGVLKSVCRVSLERDSCVQRTQNSFKRWGLKAMLFSRFVPGLSTLSAPAAGANGEPLSKFVLYDLGGVTFYSSLYIMIGFFFAGQIKEVLELVSSASGNITMFLVSIVVVYIAVKFTMRHWMIYQSKRLSVPAKDVQARYAADPTVLIVDIRGPHDHEVDPFTIPGARKFLAAELMAHAQSLPKSTTIYIYCNCPNQVSSTALSLKLRRMGFTANPILDGMAGWRQAGLEVVPLDALPQPKVTVTLMVAGQPV